MRIRHLIYIMMGAALSSCAESFDHEGEAAKDMEMVLFSAGTKANALAEDGGAKTYYMPQNGRFFCRMYHQKGDGTVRDFHMVPDVAWLKVNNSVGNSVYWNKDYNPAGSTDSHGNDADAEAFYWKNRQEHAFLAWTDNNHLTTVDLTEEDDTTTFATYDMRRTEAMTTMEDQTDVIQALTIKAPTSATLAANRIQLVFKHQFSQIQVNIKNSKDNSVLLTKEQIKKVELLGVTEKGYVSTVIEDDGTVKPTSYKLVSASDYTTEELKKNPYGTSLEMFQREVEIPEVIKSFEAIAYGMLQAIRITWQETESEGGVVHEATYRVDSDLQQLQSGVRYIWNMEMRRGTLAVVRADVMPWEINNEEYTTDGTINKK